MSNMRCYRSLEIWDFITGDVSHDYSEHIPPESSDTKIQSDTLPGENIPAEDNIVATLLTQS